MKRVKSSRSLLIICGILGILAVSLGAFGAHGLKSILPVDKHTTYTTGITYHFYHTLAILGALILQQVQPSKWYRRAAILFILGILFFSGSLYLLATREVIGLSTYKWLGPITPVGGIFFILGWLFLCVGAYQQSDNSVN